MWTRGVLPCIGRISSLSPINVCIVQIYHKKVVAIHNYDSSGLELDELIRAVPIPNPIDISSTKYCYYKCIHKYKY